MNPYAADDTPTGPIHGLVPATVAMPITKPLPPHLSWAMAELRPHLEIVSARFRGLRDDIERVAAQLAQLQRALDIEVERHDMAEGARP